MKVVFDESVPNPPCATTSHDSHSCPLLPLPTLYALRLHFGSSHSCSSRFLLAFVRRMGRNRKFVLEDNLQQEVVWRTIMRGPRPPSASWPQKGKHNSSAAAPSKAQSPPSSDAKKVQAPPSPKSKVSSIQAAVLAVLSGRDALQRTKGQFQAITESSSRARERVAEAQARVSRWHQRF